MKKPFFRIGSFICICLIISMVYAQPNRRGMRRRFGLPPADQLKALAEVLVPKALFVLVKGE